MKRLLSSLLILFLLTGCGQANDTNTKKEVEKTEKKEIVKEQFDENRCAIEKIQEGYSMDIKLNSKDGRLKETILTAMIPDIYNFMGVDETTLNDEQKNVLKEQLLSELLVHEKAKGISYKPVFKGNRLTVTLTINLDQADKELKKQLAENEEDALSLKTTLERLQANGYECN